MEGKTNRWSMKFVLSVPKPGSIWLYAAWCFHLYIDLRSHLFSKRSAFIMPFTSNLSPFDSNKNLLFHFSNFYVFDWKKLVFCGSMSNVFPKYSFKLKSWIILVTSSFWLMYAKKNDSLLYISSCARYLDLQSIWNINLEITLSTSVKWFVLSVSFMSDIYPYGCHLLQPQVYRNLKMKYCFCYE